jgi:hypothetical protein
VSGVVLDVTDAKVFTARKGNKSIGKDYYHVIIELKKLPAGDGHGLVDMARELESISDFWKFNERKLKTLARVYYPVVSNVSDRQKSVYDKKDFTFVIDKKKNCIPYQVSNPKLLVGKTVEVTGAIKTEDNGDYYINQIVTFKIFDG